MVAADLALLLSERFQTDARPSDLPIETLRASFAELYSAYDACFESHSESDRRHLFEATARRTYGGPAAAAGHTIGHPDELPAS